ncbi:hypothetical protein F4803DRAFT_2389 [Xylaria telfairii]|nr:hypothetical protein F4803DRAFT_2389 [Xylaria telfairii]
MIWAQHWFYVLFSLSMPLCSAGILLRMLLVGRQHLTQLGGGHATFNRPSSFTSVFLDLPRFPIAQVSLCSFFA